MKKTSGNIAIGPATTSAPRFTASGKLAGKGDAGEGAP